MSSRSLLNNKEDLAESGYPGESDTAAAGGASTITLGASGSAVNSTYIGGAIEITGGTGIGQVRTIASYVGGTKVATVTPAWDTPPDNTSVYVIYGIHAVAQAGSTATSIVLAAAASAVNDVYKDCYIRITAGTAAEQVSRIVGYNGTTKVATLATILTAIPDATSSYVISGESGGAQAFAANTITLDANALSAVDDYYNGAYVEVITANTAATSGQIRKITDYVGATKVATIEGTWETTPDTPARYRIFGGWGGTYEKTDTYSAYSFSIGATTNEYGIIEVAAGANDYGINSNGVDSRRLDFEVWGETPTPYKYPNAYNDVIYARWLRVAVISLGTRVTGSCATRFARSISDVDSIDTSNPIPVTGTVAVSSVGGTVNVAGALTTTPVAKTIARFLDIDEGTADDIGTGAASFLHNVVASNNDAADLWLKIYNGAAATSLSTPVMTLLVPIGQTVTFDFEGAAFDSTAIGFRATTGVADTDVGAPAANGMVVTALWSLQ